MAATQVESKAVEQISEACGRFLESLSPEQRATTTFNYLDGERLFWYYPPMNRHGLSLRHMDGGQRKLAYAILASSLTSRAYEQATQIMDLEEVLGPLEKEQGRVTFDRDPTLYYFTIFGEPGGEDPWAWRAEGHHVSLHFSVWGDKVISATPFFFGANPAEVRNGPKKGQRILSVSEDLSFELMNELDAAQRSKAIIYEKAPWDLLTFNASRPSLPAEEGLPGSQMSGTQKKILMSLVTEYVSRTSTEISRRTLASMEQEGIDGLHFAWGGPVEHGQAHYYRIHGGKFVVEFDNRQNGANHIHSVWRDVENDFAQDVMRDHLLMYHVL